MDKKTVDIYIYVNNGGKIVEFPAFIFSETNPSLIALSAYDPDNRHILTQIGREPGMVFNNTIWFYEKNFDKAKSIFLSDIAQKLDELQIKEKELRNQLSWIADQKED